MSRLTFNIIALARCGTQFRSEKMAAYGLKGFHISYILHICHCPGISQDRLAQRIYINKSNVARQAAFLEEQGFITRKSCETDKRVLQLYPTEKTMAIMEEIRGIVKCWEDCISHDLTDDEMELLSNLLARMKTRAAAYMEDR